MKTIISTVLVFIGIIFVTSCVEEKKEPTVETVVLKDITDKIKTNPLASDLIELIDLRTNSLQGAVFAVRSISDVSFTTRHEAKLPPQNKWMVNEFERAKEIKKFTAEIAKLLSIETIDSGKTYSSIYLPLAKELNNLGMSKAERRILLVYSDLMENTPELSFYNEKDFALLSSNGNYLFEHLEKIQPIGDLSNIEIHMIYEPTDIVKDKQFRAVSGFYKKLLEKHGATVIIAANLN